MRHRSRAGFTLIEVVVALALGGGKAGTELADLVLERGLAELFKRQQARQLGAADYPVHGDPINDKTEQQTRRDHG